MEIHPSRHKARLLVRVDMGATSSFCSLNHLLRVHVYCFVFNKLRLSWIRREHRVYSTFGYHLLIGRCSGRRLYYEIQHGIGDDNR